MSPRYFSRALKRKRVWPKSVRVNMVVGKELAIAELSSLDGKNLEGHFIGKNFKEVALEN